MGFDENSNPIRLTVTVYPADRNYLAYDEGLVPANPAALDVSAGVSKPKR